MESKCIALSNTCHELLPLFNLLEGVMVSLGFTNQHGNVFIKGLFVPTLEHLHKTLLCWIGPTGISNQ
eukprot:7704-Ditylum_brightwellii.AAC.1